MLNSNFFLQKPTLIRLIILLVGFVFFTSGIGALHLFDWDEINFAESAREMLVTGDYSLVQINFQPFWEKPPLFNWMQIVSMKIFGINEFAARFPNAICGMITLLLLFEFGRKIMNSTFGILWSLTYFGSLLSFLYFKSGIIDPWFNLFIFVALYIFYLAFHTEKTKQQKNLFYFFSGIILGLAVLTKGPVAYLLFFLTIFFYVLLLRQWKKIQWIGLFYFSLSAVLVGGAYHIYLLLSGRGQVLVDFVVYQIRLAKTEDAGHGGFFMYHFVVLLFGMFPASFFAIASFFKKETKSYRDLKFFFSCLFWVVLIVFSIVNTKIVHYSSLCYFPLTFLASTFIYDVLVNKKKISRWITVCVSVFMFLLSLLPLGVLYVATHVEKIEAMKIIKDDFAVACLKTPVAWTGWEFLVGVFFVVIICLWLFLKSVFAKTLSLFIGTASFFLLILFFYIGKIESYSQRPAIEMCEKFADGSAWVSTIGYKSYAPYFYSKRLSAPTREQDENTWLLHGNIDKPAFFIVKVNTMADILQNNPQLIFVEQKGGFALLRRK